MHPAQFWNLALGDTLPIQAASKKRTNYRTPFLIRERPGRSGAEQTWGDSSQTILWAPSPGEHRRSAMEGELDDDDAHGTELDVATARVKESLVAVHTAPVTHGPRPPLAHRRVGLRPAHAELAIDARARLRTLLVFSLPTQRTRSAGSQVRLALGPICYPAAGGSTNRPTATDLRKSGQSPAPRTWLCGLTLSREERSCMFGGEKRGGRQRREKRVIY